MGLRRQEAAVLIEISWASARLARVAASDVLGTRRWGPERWPRIKVRIATLLAAPNLAAMVGMPGKLHMLSGDREGQFALTVSASYRLVFEVGDDPIPRQPDGGIDISRVTRIRILGVVDYHGD